MSTRNNNSLLLDIDWHYDTGSERSYIMVSGNEREMLNTELNKIVEKFEEKGFKRRSSGPTNRFSNNGIKYQNLFG
jgi:hypothetical protein